MKPRPAIAIPRKINLFPSLTHPQARVEPHRIKLALPSDYGDNGKVVEILPPSPPKRSASFTVLISLTVSVGHSVCH